MYNSAIRRSGAALIATTALLGATTSAYAADGQESGTASAFVLKTNADVSLISGTAKTSLDLTLNEVSAPEGTGSADETLLTATLEGVHGGKPFEVLRAEVANARASKDADGTEAETKLVDAEVNLPGLTQPLLAAELVTAKAVCAVGEAPTADAKIPGTVTVLGEKTELTAEGTATVEVDGVGTVKLDLAKREVTDSSAAATALDLNVSVDPLALNVAAVEGTVTLAHAECTTPAGTDTTGGATEGATEGDSGGDSGGAGGDAGATEGPTTQTGDGPDLAETGGDSSTVYLAGGAVALLGAGGAALYLARRRAASRA